MSEDTQEKLSSWKSWLIKKLLNDDSSKEEILNIIASEEEGDAEKDNIDDMQQQFSDGSLHILNSNYRDVAIVKFRDLFPINLSSLEFESSETDIKYFTAEVTFKYTIYDILAADGRTPL